MLKEYKKAQVEVIYERKRLNEMQNIANSLPLFISGEISRKILIALNQCDLCKTRIENVIEALKDMDIDHLTNRAKVAKMSLDSLTSMSTDINNDAQKIKMIIRSAV